MPTEFPPLGSMAIIQSLRKIGKEVQFYNIDYFRPKHDDIVAYFGENRFDIVGISAVVSTAYKYTKYLSGVIRSVSSNTVIVVGGNLAASAEILLRKCGVDFCVVGDGELIIQDLVKALEEKSWSYEQTKAILGICFLDQNGQFHFTGYRKPLSADAIEWPDYSILEADGSLPNYIEDTPSWLEGYALEIPEEMYGNRSATVCVGKGCVCRCTFCHRWEKGYRARPLDQIIEHIQYLKDRYNVGFLSLCDESFGSNRKLTWELVARLGEMGMIWRAGGVRTRTVDRETLIHWKANGCRMVIYGIESGSQTMLDVMEKKTTVQMNIDALKWTHEAGLVTIVQLVLGMPGETDHTIQETIDFLKECMPYYPTVFRGRPTTIQSINYAQALPGTPLYEYTRQHGFIGKKLDNEEQYLIRISDIDAVETKHFINYTRQPLLKVLMWRYKILGGVNAHYMKYLLGITLSFPEVVWDLLLRTIRLLLGKVWSKHKNIKAPLDDALAKYLDWNYEDYSRSFKFKPSPAIILFLNPISRRWLYPLLVLAVSIKKADSSLQPFILIADHLRWSLMHRFRPALKFPKKSLRKIVVIEPPTTADEGSEMMIPLRLGR